MPGKPKSVNGQLMEIVQQLRKASKMHAEQADRIEQMCREMMGGASKMQPQQHPEAIMIATPPPDTTPPSCALLTAFKASSMRSFRSPISTEVAPPTLITATPDDILEMRS